MSTPRKRMSFRQATEPTGAFQVWRKLHRRHLQWAVLAVVLSVILHVLLILLFPGVTIYGFSRERLLQEARVALKLHDVRTQAEPAEAERRPARFRPEAARGTVAGDASSESVAFRRPVDEANVEPRRIGAGALAGEDRTLVEPDTVNRTVWEPRQDIVSINRRVVQDDVAALPRRYVEAIPRQKTGADIAGPADRSDAASGLVAALSYDVTDDPAKFQWGSGSGGGGTAGRGAAEGGAASVIRVEPRPHFDETQRVSVLKALERYLKADVQVYRPALDSRYSYCRIEVKRRTSDLLPVLEKDVLLVQDASASITEQKLYYCREGMLRALELIGPGDRFNVVEFRTGCAKCFSGWAPADMESLQRAREFILGIRSEGDTDIFGSMRELLNLPRKPGRPVIAIVVSDGVATVGLTDRSQIIESFSQANAGAVSVFTMGTYAGANAYLLDLLSYRNRGDTHIVRTLSLIHI